MLPIMKISMNPSPFLVIQAISYSNVWEVHPKPTTVFGARVGVIRSGKSLVFVVKHIERGKRKTKAHLGFPLLGDKKPSPSRVSIHIIEIPTTRQLAIAKTKSQNRQQTCNRSFHCTEDQS